MSNYRFRVDDGKLVLQVLRPAKYSPYNDRREEKWEDASVGDIPVADPFRREVEGGPLMVRADDQNWMYER